MIYLDNASTTKPFVEVCDLLSSIQLEMYYNPSATYNCAINVKNQIDLSRKKIAEVLGVKSSEIYFTSGATESNNWIIENAFKNKKGNIVISAGEHVSVYEKALQLKNKGLDVRIAKILPNGEVDCKNLLSLVDDNTCLVSVIHTSNEVGTCNDINEISKFVKNINNKTFFHSDGVQAFCKFDYNLSQNIDFYTFSSHKINGTKGIGAIYIRFNSNIAPLIMGGSQENNLRAGTENSVGIIAMGKAVEIQKKLANNYSEMYNYVAQFIEKNISGATINGKHTKLFNIMSISLTGVKSEILQNLLEEKGILIGRGSACSSKKSGNRVLSEMGLEKKLIDGNIRISFGVDNNMEQVKIFCNELKKCVDNLRSKILSNKLN